MVAETLIRSGNLHSSSNLRVTVDFPAPLGPEMMINCGETVSDMMDPTELGLTISFF